MQASDCNDRWERRKRYLLQNFLVNPDTRLSTIRESSEEERSSPDSGSLPDLVVEPTPDRHDHPPEYYEGLERRMKRYYRKLFLGANESDDDSSEFEVNRDMASTSMLDIDTRKDNYIDDTIVKKRKLTKSNESDGMRQVTNSTIKSPENDENENQNKYDDIIIDTCETYDHTRDVFGDSKYLSGEDQETPKLIETCSINESIHSYKSNDTDNQSGLRTGDTLKKSGENLKENSTNSDRPKNNREALNERDASKIYESISDSEDTASCHRISSTVAEIHETRPERSSSQLFDNGSPVMIPRLLQLSRRVFGSRQAGSFNVSKVSDKIKRLSSQNADALPDENKIPETQVRRLLSASDITKASIVSEKNIDTEKIVDYSDTEEDWEKDDFNKNYHIRNTIQLSEIRVASLDFNKSHDTENVLHYIDAGNKNQEDGNKKDRSDITEKWHSINQDDDTVETMDLQNTTIHWNKDGIDDDEDGFDNAVRRGEFATKARKMIFVSSSDDSFEDLEPIAQSSAKSIDDEELEVMREARASGGIERRYWHDEAVQDSPTLAFETQANSVKPENEPSDSTEINASFEEETEANESIKNSTNTPHNAAIIVDDFWSVSPIDVDIEELAEVSRSNKRRKDSDGAPSKRKKKNIATQTGSEENSRKWEDMRTELFVGSPLVFRLCGCQDHICPRPPPRDM